MIARLSGKLIEKNGASSAIIDVAGVGYEVILSAGDYHHLLIDTDVVVFTHHHIREQAQELFGFSTPEAKKLFELLITVQGVGPRAAMAILSIDSAENVRNAIAGGDSKFISRANGVGKKSSERVIVDLRDKVGFAVGSSNSHGSLEPFGPSGSYGDDAVDALMALGFTLADAETALSAVPSDLATPARVTAALKNLR